MHRLLVLVVALVCTPVLAKSLHWSALDVTAQLDGDGRLHVTERQTIVFDGDWNGGERTFRISAGQSLEFDAILKVDGEREHLLTRGDLSTVDHYDFTSGNVLRWRSRLPDDPPFENTAFTYVLRYRIAGVLQESDGKYLLDHDFAFPDRNGVIERFSLRLELDPVWRGVDSPITISRQQLEPGQSVVVSKTLDFAGDGRPATAIQTLSNVTVYVVLALFLFAMALVIFDFYLAERAKGRFDPLLKPDLIDDEWLAEHLFFLRPEVAGAALDGKTGASEVAAVLARMAQEGKIASSVETRRRFLIERKVLCLTLEANRDSLPPHEGKLVRALFFNNRKTTDTDAIRKYYQNRGFDPAAIVEKGVIADLQRLPSWNKHTRRANWQRNSLYVVAAFVFMIVTAFSGSNDGPAVAFAVLVGAFVLGLASAAANASSRAVTALFPRFLIPALFLAPLIALVVRTIVTAGPRLLHVTTLIAISAWATAIVKMTLDALRSPEAPEKIAFRKELAAARNYFIAQLRAADPKLRDEWYPYLLAFGLGSQVERWFGAYGSPAVASSASTMGSASSSVSTGEASARSWSGGGGAFGGAGATGGWATALGSLAAGVSAPSSSGSGSGGSSSSSSSSGSSSGGGGGGGW